MRRRVLIGQIFGGGNMEIKTFDYTFQETRMGSGAETHDFIVNLIESNVAINKPWIGYVYFEGNQHTILQAIYDMPLYSADASQLYYLPAKPSVFRRYNSASNNNPSTVGLSDSYGSNIYAGAIMHFAGIEIPTYKLLSDAIHGYIE